MRNASGADSEGDDRTRQLRKHSEDGTGYGPHIGEFKLRRGRMARIRIKANTMATTTVGGTLSESADCSKVTQDSPKLTRELDCAGEWTQAVAYINAPEYQNMLVIPSATSLNDATDKARRCGGGHPVTWYDNPVLACAPYIRCNL
jgi:hypothetical protein